VRAALTVGVLLRSPPGRDALHYAHELSDTEGKPMGLVHRDVTPPEHPDRLQRIPKLTDFGSPKGDQSRLETQPGRQREVPYMSPGKRSQEGPIVAPHLRHRIVLWEARPERSSSRDLADGGHRRDSASSRSFRRAKCAGTVAIVDPIVMKALKRRAEAALSTATEMKQDIEELIDRAGSEDDATTISKEFAEIFGGDHRRSAFALRAAMAGRADLEEMARVLGAKRLRDGSSPGDHGRSEPS